MTMELIELENDEIKGILKYDSDLFQTRQRKSLSLFTGIFSMKCFSLVTDLFLICSRQSGKSVKPAESGWHLTVASTFTANMLQESFPVLAGFTRNQY